MSRRWTAKTRLVFRDRDGQEASTHIYLPFAYTLDQIFAFVNAAIPRYLAVSNAIIVRVEVVYEWYYRNLPEAEEGSDSTRTLLLFYRNENGTIDVLSIVSPRNTIYETTGPYAGIRIDKNHPAIVAWQDITVNGLLTFVNQYGELLGPELLTGGIAI